MSSCENQEIIQKRINKQVRVPSSMYTMNFSTLNNTINNNNEGKKHDSYQRRLNNLKNRVNTRIKIGDAISNDTPVQGNKNKALSIGSCNLDVDNYLQLNCDFEAYISYKGVTAAYDDFSLIQRRPTTLTIPESNDVSFAFGNDLTFFKNADFSQTTAYIPFDTYNTSNGTQNLGQFMNSKPFWNSWNSYVFTAFIDFQINDSINDITINTPYPIFEIGNGTGAGMTVVLQKVNNNTLNMILYIGKNDTNSNTFVTTHIPLQFNVNEFNNRHFMIISFEGNGSYISLKVLYDTNIVYYKENWNNDPENDVDSGVFNNTDIGFGIYNPQGTQSDSVSLPNDLIQYYDANASLEIKGQYKLYQNSYDELIRSNYFETR